MGQKLHPAATHQRQSQSQNSTNLRVTARTVAPVNHVTPTQLIFIFFNVAKIVGVEKRLCRNGNREGVVTKLSILCSARGDRFEIAVAAGQDHRNILSVYGVPSREQRREPSRAAGFYD